MRPHDPPPPTYAFAYHRPPVPGNSINGLGETAARRARPVFHASGGPPLAWKALDDFFSMINPWPVLRHVLANTWQLRRSDGPVAPVRRPVTGRSGRASAAGNLRARLTLPIGPRALARSGWRRVGSSEARILSASRRSLPDARRAGPA